MAQRVRILRNLVPFRSAVFRLLRVFEVGLNIYARHTRAAQHDYITEVRAAKIRKDTELAEARAHKIENDNVLQELKIEKARIELGYPAERHGAHNREGQAWE